MTTDVHVGCDAVLELISARLDGEATPAELATLDAHLATCSTCTATATRLDRLHRQARLAPAPEVPDLVPAVLAAHDRERKHRRGSVLAVAAAAVALIGAGALVVVTGGSTPPPAVAVSDARVLAAAPGQLTPLELKVTNQGGADRIIGIETPVADRGELHAVERLNGVDVMQTITSVTIPSRGEESLDGSDAHVMLIGVRAPLTPGERVPVTLRFERAGNVEVDAVVTS